MHIQGWRYYGFSSCRTAHSHLEEIHYWAQLFSWRQRWSDKTVAVSGHGDLRKQLYSSFRFSWVCDISGAPQGSFFTFGTNIQILSGLTHQAVTTYPEWTQMNLGKKPLKTGEPIPWWRQRITFSSFCLHASWRPLKSSYPIVVVQL